MILKELKIKTWIGDATNCYIRQDEKSKETMGRSIVLISTYNESVKYSV